MLSALFADIHGNLEALEACLRHARERGAQRHVFLGDFVGYGADPAAVVARVAEQVDGGAIALRGNHDEAVEHPESYFNDAAQAALDWARETLSADQKRFLAALPLTASEGNVLYVHASAATPEKWHYIDSPGAARRSIDATDAVYSFCGHVHDQALYFQSGVGKIGEFRPNPGTPIAVRDGRRWLAIVGSVGQPRDRNPAAAYALFDDERRQITFHRVPYDADAAAGKIRRAGLPESLAFRVELGI